ncbi:MAG: alkaline phosphatase [Opitutus sp.]|nr:alkaline phosphatase [Opitutus sp.]
MPRVPPPLYPLAGANTITRRSFLVGTASFAAAALLSPRLRALTATRVPGGLFTLGVASGDPAPDGMVLWTRLAPRPLEAGGGMPAEPVEVHWEIAEDEAMSRVVQRGTATADPAWAHSVHVEVAGLRAERWYWYRFRAGGETSPVGRTRTLPPPDALPDRLRFAFVSCQKYEIGYYTAFEHLAREDLDLVVHLGDYIYEKGDDDRAVRPHGQKEIFSVDDYRARYALYKTDPALQAAHAMAPWIVTWDDHEVSNNYANDQFAKPGVFTSAEFLLRRAAAYQAYYEHMPLRRSALPRGPDMLLYRRLHYGRLASFHVLDTRQYRSDQPLHDGERAPDPVLLDPQGTMLGDRQREWFFGGLAASSSVWNVIAQQVMVGRLDYHPGRDMRLAMDKWSGYEFERRRLLRELRDGRAKNPVVITGDIHCNWANQLATDFDAPDAPPVAVEFVGTSVTSGGDGRPKFDEPDAVLADNPFVKFFNDERGYVSCEVTPTAWRTHYRTVLFVSRRGAPLNTRATFVVESGRPLLLRA